MDTNIGTAVELIDADSYIASFVAPETETREELDFLLTVQDDDGLKGTASLPITVNKKPSVDAGLDQSRSIPAGQTAAITLTATDDDDGEITSRTWVQTGGAAIAFSGKYTSTIAFTLPATTGAYTFRYTVIDNESAEAFDTVSVYVTKILYPIPPNSANWTNIVDNTGTGAVWTASGGVLQQSAFLASPSGAYDGATSYHVGTYAIMPWNGSDFRFSVDITPLPNPSNALSKGNDVGIMFLRQNDDYYYRVSMNSKQGFTRFERVSGGSFQTLAVNARGYVYPNQAVNMMVEVNSGDIVVWIDGAPVFALADADTPTYGYVALYCQESARFDNVLITEPSLAPQVVISSPLAYSIALTPDGGNTLVSEAVVLNAPSNSSVRFMLDGGTEIQGAASGNVYSAQFDGVSTGDHVLTAILRDARGNETASDVNDAVGVGGDYCVTVGDSITAGMGDNIYWNNDSADERMITIQGFQANLADEQTDSTGRPQIVFNEGVEGDESSELRNRINSILERHPGANKVLLMIGTNDSGAGITPDIFSNNVQTIASRTLAGNDKRLWIAKPPRTYYDIENTWIYDTSRNDLLYQYNQKINTIVWANNNIEDGPNFFGEGQFLNSSSLYDDYLHPNDAGYQYMATEWVKYLP